MRHAIDFCENFIGGSVVKFIIFVYKVFTFIIEVTISLVKVHPFITFTKNDQLFNPTTPTIYTNKQNIYCLKITESANKWQISRPPIPLPCGHHNAQSLMNEQTGCSRQSSMQCLFQTVSKKIFLDHIRIYKSSKVL